MMSRKVILPPIFFLLLQLVTLSAKPSAYEGNNHNAGGKMKDIHGGVKMGEINHECDDVEWNLKLDWDNSTDYEYTCQKNEKTFKHDSTIQIPECLPKEDIPYPLHKCMDTPIVYEDTPPVAGRHRPNWPVFGTYVYIPPQRWVHALEHGAVVALFHPCAKKEQIETLITVTRSCIRKHVISPYRHLPPEQPLALITYGCKLLMSRVNVPQAQKFIQEHALDTVESPVTKDGKYGWGLIKQAEIVTKLDEKRKDLCPKMAKQLPISENMPRPYWPGGNAKNI